MWLSCDDGWCGIGVGKGWGGGTDAPEACFEGSCESEGFVVCAVATSEPVAVVVAADGIAADVNAVGRGSSSPICARLVDCKRFLRTATISPTKTAAARMPATAPPMARPTPPASLPDEFGGADGVDNGPLAAGALSIFSTVTLSSGVDRKVDALAGLARRSESVLRAVVAAAAPGSATEKETSTEAALIVSVTALTSTPSSLATLIVMAARTSGV